MSIQELENFFNQVQLPKEVFLHPAIKIIDVQQFLTTSFIQVNTRGTGIPAYNRLLQLKAILENDNTALPVES